MLSLMLFEGSKQGTRFIPNERLRALIYQEPNKTMHSSFITFGGAVRTCVPAELECCRRSAGFSLPKFKNYSFVDSNSCFKDHVPLGLSASN